MSSHVGGSGREFLVAVFWEAPRTLSHGDFPFACCGSAAGPSTASAGARRVAARLASSFPVEKSRPKVRTRGQKVPNLRVRKVGVRRRTRTRGDSARQARVVCRHASLRASRRRRRTAHAGSPHQPHGVEGRREDTAADRCRSGKEEASRHTEPTRRRRGTGNKHPGGVGAPSTAAFSSTFDDRHHAVHTLEPSQARACRRRVRSLTTSKEGSDHVCAH